MIAYREGDVYVNTAETDYTVFGWTFRRGFEFFLETIQRFMMPAQSKTVDINDDAGQKKVRRLGSMKGQKFIADGHDIIRNGG